MMSCSTSKQMIQNLDVTELVNEQLIYVMVKLLIFSLIYCFCLSKNVVTFSISV